MFGCGVLVAAMLVMKLLPHSPYGEWLNATLVERPLARLAGMDRRHVVFVMIDVGLALFATDMVFVFGSYDLMALYAWDLTVYLDTMVIAYTLTTVALARSSLRWLTLRASLALRRARRPQARRSRAASLERQDLADNDDDPPPAWALAA
jgi:ABC-type multidrug transport system fused ATPase/permease subunit